ncbi:hypothetical protein D9M68_439270 [compost metagenome]
MHHGWKAQFSRSGSRANTFETLLDPYGASLLRMGEAFHPFTWLPPSAGNGGRRLKHFFPILPYAEMFLLLRRTRLSPHCCFSIRDLPWLGEVVRAKKPARLPVVLSITEVQQVLSRLHG